MLGKLAAAAGLLCGPAALMATHCWFATDASQKINTEWDCRTFDWILQIYTHGDGGSFGPYFGGYAYVNGLCTGDYTDCSNVYRPPNQIEGQRTFQYLVNWHSGSQTISAN
jgi:hypothetical protein